MGILDRLRLKYAYPVMVRSGGEWAERVLDMDAAQLYASQPNLRAVVSFLADNIAQLPLKCYVREGESDRRRVRDTTAALLFERPNPDMTRYELVRSLVSDICVYDRALWWVIPSADTPSGWEIRPIPPAWVKEYIEEGPFAPKGYKIQAPGGNLVDVDASEVILFHGWRADDPMRGSSPIESLKNTLVEQIEAQRYRESVWKNNGRMGAWVSRPKDVEPWTPEQADRWKRDFRDAWTTSQAKEAGGVIVLEDGMALNNFEFSAKEAQWAESVHVSREECAGVYHLNPNIVWPSGSMTYASVKENARALYNDTLGAPIVMIEERINAFLLPMIGAEPNEYVELDFSAKLRGSVEEQMQSLYTATGRPFMTADEARAKLNMPAIDGGEGLALPLNLLIGDDSSTQGDYGLSENAAREPVAVKSEEPIIRKSRGKPSQDESDAMADAFRKFFDRQSKVVLAKLGASKSKSDEEWWDAERWDAELSDDLFVIVYSQSQANAERALRELMVDGDYIPAKTRAYLRSMCDTRASAVNRSTLKALINAIEGELSDDAAQSTPAGVFDVAKESRADSLGLSLSTAVAGWTALEAVRQCAPHERCMKTWVVTSGNPRPTHAMLDGETVPYDETFSNGAEWPGDTGALDVGEIVNCQCQVELSIN